MTPRKAKESTIMHENTNIKSILCVKYNVKLDKSTQGEKTWIRFVSRRPANGRKTYQGGLISAWNAFPLNVSNSSRYLRWWGKLFHPKEPEKEKLVWKISVLVLGKFCLFPWTRRRSEGIVRSFRYCKTLPGTTFCIKTHLLSNSFLSRGSSLRAQHFWL